MFLFCDFGNENRYIKKHSTPQSQFNRKKRNSYKIHIFSKIIMNWSNIHSFIIYLLNMKCQLFFYYLNDENNNILYIYMNFYILYFNISQLYNLDKIDHYFSVFLNNYIF